MTKRTKKLSLNKETVRTLSDRQMSKAVGGIDGLDNIIKTNLPGHCGFVPMMNLIIR